MEAGKDIILLIVGIALVVFLGYGVYTLVQIKTTARTLACTIGELNQRLPTILKNLEEITANTVQVTDAVKRQVDDLSLTVAKIDDAVTFYLDKERIFRREVSVPVADAFRPYLGVIKGIRAFLDSWRSSAPAAKSG